MDSSKPRQKIGLALGSGGYRGPAHIGVIKTLVKHGIPIDYLSGCSIGAWVAAHYAVYQDVERLEAEALEQQKEKMSCFLDLNWNNGLLSGRKIQSLLEKSFNYFRFEDAGIPLGIVATDLISGQGRLFNSGSIPLAVRASISIPFAFTPVKIDGMQLADGGLTNPVPDDIVKDMGADIVIAVNIYNDYALTGVNLSLPKVVMRSVEIVMTKLAQNTMNMADVIIEPNTSSFSHMSRLKRYFTPTVIRSLIRAGEISTEAAIPKIKKLIS